MLYESDNSYYGEISYMLGENYNLVEPRRMAICGDRLYVADMELNCVKIFDKKTFKYLGAIEDESFDRVESVAATEEYIYVNDRFNHEIKVYNAETLEYVESFGNFTDVHSIEIHDGSLYVADFEDEIVYKYELNTLEATETYEFDYVLDFAINGTTMYAVHRDNSFTTYNLITGDSDNIYFDNGLEQMRLFGIYYYDDMLYFADREGFVYRYNLQDGTLDLEDINGRLLREPYSVAVDGDIMYVASTKHNKVILYDKETFEVIDTISEVDGYGNLGNIRGIDIHDGKIYLADFTNENVVILDKNTHELVHVLSDNFDGVEDVVANDDFIFVNDRFNHQFNVYNADDYQCVGGIDELYDVHNLALYENYLIVADYGGNTVYVFQADGGDLLSSFFAEGVMGIAAHEDLIYIGYYDGIMITDFAGEVQATHRNNTRNYFDFEIYDNTLYIADRFEHNIITYKIENGNLTDKRMLQFNRDEMFYDLADIAYYNGNIYVANYSYNEVTVLDAKTLDYKGSITENVSECIGVSIINDRLYLTNYFFNYSTGSKSSYINIYDLTDNSLIDTIDNIEGTPLNSAYGITAANGRLYIADCYKHVVYIVDPDDFSLLDTLGTYEQGGDDETHLYEPTAVTVSGGRLYVADCRNHKIKIYDEETLEYIAAIDDSDLYYPFSCTVHEGVIYVCNSGYCIINAYDEETLEFLGYFPDEYTDFDFAPFVLFVDDYFYVSDYFEVYVYKKTFSDQSEIKDITDEIDGTYTIAGTIEAGEEISIAITVNPPEENPLSGAAYWAPQSINGVSFEADPQNPNRYTATLTLEELGEQDIEIIWSKQIYFNRFVEWQASEYQGKTTKTTTVIIDLTPLTDLINEAQALLAGAVPGEGNGQYPQSAITALQNAIAAAAEVSHEESLTPQELNDAIDALTEAMEAFEDARIAVDNKPLSDAVQNAKGMQKGNYTDQSWSNLQKAINNAKALLNKGNYTQQEIDNALNAIASAIKALENKSKNPGTGDSANLNALIMLAIASLSAIILSNKKKLPC